MNKRSPTAGQIAGRLTAEKIKPLVEYVEQATGTKLRIPNQQGSVEAKEKASGSVNIYTI